MKVLVTGGAGYIGSHTCVELLEENCEVIVVDNFSNSNPSSLDRIQEITGKTPVFYSLDVCDKDALRKVFAEHEIDAVVHFAGLKSPSESVATPLQYYHNNLFGTLLLCEVMAEYGVKKFVFSSTANVYGYADAMPITEDSPLSPTNPYGRSKWMVEELLRDLQASDDEWSIAILRYFNPVGAHVSGLIGESPKGDPNNLMPYIARVAAGEIPELSVFGGDYPTKDGTGVRDYIHVVDLALGHVKTLQMLHSNPGVSIFNLGTGHGFSVLELVDAFEKSSGQSVPFHMVGRRSGDAAVSYADVSRASKELRWKAERSLAQMCEDAWRWQLTLSG